MNRHRILAVVLLGASCSAALAQAAPGEAPGSDGSGEYALRMTPAMARGMAREFVHDELIRRYEIDAAREEELRELVARRIMEAAHEVDTPEHQAAAQRLLGNFFELVLESERTHRRLNPSPELARALGQDLLPLLPNVQELVRKVGQDVRPMMSMKQQLRLAADLMAVKTAMDGFEATMRRWADGQLRPGDDPFDDDGHEAVQVGADGVSEEVRRARESSGGEDRLSRLTNMWEQYVKTASEFYGFDEAQRATAESIVRETVTRASAVLNGTEFLAHDADNRFWLRFWRELGPEFRGDQPVMYLLLRQNSSLQDPLNALTDEFKQRVDRIARQDQQRAAEQRIEEILAQAGYRPPAEAGER